MLARHKNRAYDRRMNTETETPKAIIDRLGVGAIAEAVGVARVRVRRAKYDRRLPAVWFAALEALNGGPLPRAAFNFSGADSP